MMVVLLVLWIVVMLVVGIGVVGVVVCWSCCVWLLVLIVGD
jgi:hypothetical protein